MMQDKAEYERKKQMMINQGEIEEDKIEEEEDDEDQGEEIEICYICQDYCISDDNTYYKGINTYCKMCYNGFIERGSESDEEEQEQEQGEEKEQSRKRKTYLKEKSEEEIEEYFNKRFKTNK